VDFVEGSLIDGANGAITYLGELDDPRLFQGIP
jgi:hypothetical protein